MRFDWAGVTVRHLRSINDIDFGDAYAELWSEFGEKNELESRDVLVRRFAWRPEDPTHDGIQKLYDFVVIRCGGAIAAVADHTAVVNLNRPDVPVVVHVSHVLVAPRFRGTGLAGWVRALPLATARKLIEENALPPRPVVLAGEMEHARADRPHGFGRLIAFEKAGYSKIDPACVHYLQPDFRPPAQIDAAGGPTPVPLSLVVRRVGQEHARTITGGDVRAIVDAIYAVYADGLRPSEMKTPRESLADFPADGDRIALVPPSKP